MKTIILTFALSMTFVTLNAQEYTIVSNYLDTNENTTYKHSLSNFVSEVFSQETFKYREFLKESAVSKMNYKIGAHVFTKKELAKLMRKGARKSENLEAFENYLNDKNSKFTNYISREDLIQLFLTFRKGTLHQYLDDLASNL